VVQRGVAINRIGVAFGRHVVAHDGDGIAAVIAFQIAERHQRRLAVLEQIVHMGADQLVGNRLQARRRFGVPVAHVVTGAIGMAK
jgi:mannitol/fructose-specific phosphotransferase system IIA component